MAEHDRAFSEVIWRITFINPAFVPPLPAARESG